MIHVMARNGGALAIIGTTMIASVFNRDNTVKCIADLVIWLEKNGWSDFGIVVKTSKGDMQVA